MTRVVDTAPRSSVPVVRMRRPDLADLDLEPCPESLRAPLSVVQACPIRELDARDTVTETQRLTMRVKLSLIGETLEPRGVETLQRLDEEELQSLIKGGLEVKGALHANREARLLTVAQEKALFAAFNALRYRCIGRIRALPALPDPESLKNIIGELQQAQALKETIAEHNMALVMGIKKAGFRYCIDHAETRAEGNAALARSIDGFDWTRGHKFGTYAGFAIDKGFRRAWRREHTFLRRYICLYGSALQQHGEVHDLDEWHRQRRENFDLSWLPKSLARLSELERAVLRERFGGEGKPPAFRDVAMALGINKDRARVIHDTALRKLRKSFEG